MASSCFDVIWLSFSNGYEHWHKYDVTDALHGNLAMRVNNDCAEMRKGLSDMENKNKNTLLVLSSIIHEIFIIRKARLDNGESMSTAECDMNGMN